MSKQFTNINTNVSYKCIAFVLSSIKSLFHEN